MKCLILKEAITFYDAFAMFPHAISWTFQNAKSNVWFVKNSNNNIAQYNK